MHELFSNPQSGYLDIALLISRIVAGTVMLYYGLPKIRNLKKNASDFVMMGFRPGWLWGTIVAFIEFFGGILMILGIWIVGIAAMFGFQMLMGTIWKITKAKKLFTDWSYDVILLALMLLLIALGAGTYAL